MIAASPLVANPASVALHPGASGTISISGANGAITVTFTQALATATVDQVSHVVTIAASAQTGNDVAHVTDASGANVDVPVRVALDAGTIPSALTLKVTGSPIDPNWLDTQITQFVLRNLNIQKGAQATVAPLSSLPAPSVGTSGVVSVPLQINGNGTYFDVSGATDVTVQNVGVEPFAPPVLFYDDDPERVTTDGLIYRGTVDSLTPARLYYYHDGGPDTRNLAVILSTAAASSVQVVDASAGPNLDVMSVGHAVSKGALAMIPNNEGAIVDLAAHATYVLHDFPLATKAGVAGSVGLQVLSGGPVTINVVAYSPGVDPATLLNGPAATPDGHHRTGVFNVLNYGTQSLGYAVGGPDVKAIYGDRDATPPNADPQAVGHDYGDYGVLQTFLFSLANPTAAPATVYLYERPIGGIVRSSFLVDGAVVDVGCVRQSIPYQIQAFQLAPGGKYQLNVQTMTDGGSNYPLEIGITAIVPQPTAPPISSPTGCFPKR